MTKRSTILVMVSLVTLQTAIIPLAAARADIFEWEYINPANPSEGKQPSTMLTPDGAGANAVPGTNLSNRDLTKAYLIGAAVSPYIVYDPNTGYIVSYVASNLTAVNLSQADLTNAYFGGADGANLNEEPIYCPGADLTDANLSQANATNANFYHATLTGANLSQADLTNANFLVATLTSADFTGAEVRGAYFGSGLTAAQLYSTASYQAHDLSGIRLQGIELTGGNLAGQNLTNATFSAATLTSADFTGAEVRGAYFGSGLTAAQLYSTASYQAHDLSGIRLDGIDLTGGNLAGQNLTTAQFSSATLTGANLSQANLTNALFQFATLTGANLSQANLQNANFSTIEYCGDTGCSGDLTNANLSGADARGAKFQYVPLTGANFTDADVRGADFYSFGSTGITAAQLSSTASYQAQDLSGIKLSGNFAGLELSGQNLTNATFLGATLTGANLSQANAMNADFSTRPYEYCDLTSANLSQANLTNANFSGYLGVIPGANLTGANLSGADARGANFQNATLTGANTRNLIQSDGHIAGLDLTAGASLAVRDYDGNPAGESPTGPLPIVVDQYLAMDTIGTLRLVFDADPWDSTISFAPGIPVTRGGALELTFASDVNLASQVGRTVDLFDWTGVNPTGAFTVSSPYTWNLSKLYTTGEVTLTALAAIPGDFNNNGVVDAADYIVWRKTDGTPAGYNAWRSHFGQTAGRGAVAGPNATVPEPTTLVMLIVAAVGLGLRCRHSAWQLSRTR